MAKKKATGGPAGAAVQISTMQRLSQSAAAWLLGLNARTLRDKSDVPRSDDGSYDARKLFAWVQARSPRQSAVDDLDDHDYERLEVAREFIGCAVNDAEVVGTYDTLLELSRKHGMENVAVWLLDRLMTDWKQEAGFARQRLTPVTQADLRKAMERCKADSERSNAIAELRVAIQCEDCGRVRHGRRWLKVDPPENHVVWMGVCPTCERKQG